MKLNLGCGNDIKEGWHNVDVHDGFWYKEQTIVPPWEVWDEIGEKTYYMSHDLEITLPIKSNTAEYILAKDVLEHFSFRDTERIFSDWCRVLKKKGQLKIVVPNIDVHIKMYQDGATRKDFPNSFEFVRGLIFGHQDYPENTHKTCFNPESVKDLFFRHKLYMIQFELDNRAIIAVGQKK